MIEAEVKRDPANFEPVTIELTFETREELDLFGSLFNWTPVTDLSIGVKHGWCSKISEVMKMVGANQNRLLDDIGKKISRHPSQTKYYR